MEHEIAYAVTAVAFSMVSNSTTGTAETKNARTDCIRVLGKRLKLVSWMVAMLATGETKQAEVKVGALLAGDEVIFGKFLAALVAAHDKLGFAHLECRNCMCALVQCSAGNRWLAAHFREMQVCWWMPLEQLSQ